VKNKQKTVGMEEKLDVINHTEKEEQIVVVAIILDLLVVAYVQFVIMLIEIMEMLSG
jgi:hypothetical protein